MGKIKDIADLLQIKVTSPSEAVTNTYITHKQSKST